MHIRQRSIPFIVSVLIVVLSISGCSKKGIVESTNDSTMTSKTVPAAEYYGVEVKIDAYNENGNTYINIDDLSTLFKTKATYNSTTNSISIGDPTRASVINYIPDLSRYPVLEDVIGLPPYEVDIGGYIGVVF